MRATRWAALMGLAALTVLRLQAASDVLTGTLRCAGDPAMAGIAAAWAKGFEALHPGVHVELHLTGSDTGIAGLYTGKADIAFMGRSPMPIEIQAFEWVFRYKPLQVDILTGSAGQAGRSPALAVIVRRDNPLAAISLPQLARLFAAAPAGPRTWGDLGLKGTWAARPVALYTPDMMSGTGRFFRHLVLADSRMLNWPQITEISGGPLGSGSEDDAGKAIARAVSADPEGLGLASLGDLAGDVRVVPVSDSDSSPPWAPTVETVKDRTYPLSRACFALVNSPPGSSPSAVVSAFLSYLLSPEGQATVASEGSYLPLQPDRAREQGRLLAPPPSFSP